jgi:hypothetical protein
MMPPTNEDPEQDGSWSSPPSDGGDSYLSRRNWVMTIGQVAIALGFSGRVQAETKDTPPLPPGLYLPSTNHLGHALMSSARLHPIPPGCPTDYIRPRIEPFTPLFLSASEFAVIRRLIQLLLGEISADGRNEDANLTQEMAEWVDLRVESARFVREAALHLDPLHRAVAVGYYGSARVNQLETSNPDKICRDGLEWLSNEVQSRYSDQFLSLTEERQLAILDSISDERLDRQSENSGTRFFTFLKAEVIRGFYTSQAGLKELGFRGNAFYARSPGCTSK